MSVCLQVTLEVLLMFAESFPLQGCAVCTPCPSGPLTPVSSYIGEIWTQHGAGNPTPWTKYQVGSETNNTLHAWSPWFHVDIHLHIKTWTQLSNAFSGLKNFCILIWNLIEPVTTQITLRHIYGSLLGLKAIKSVLWKKTHCGPSDMWH